MNRNLFVMLAIFVAALIIVVVALVIRDQSFPAAAQTALDKYIEYRYPPSEMPTVRQIARASLPWNFSSNLSGATFGYSIFYETTYDYRARPIVNMPGAPTITPIAGVSLYTTGGGHPVPYPPSDVWCVLLRENTQHSQAIVYVAFHQDLYYADWVLHEAAGSPDSKGTADALTRIGCDLKLGE